MQSVELRPHRKTRPTKSFPEKISLSKGRNALMLLIEHFVSQMTDPQAQQILPLLRERKGVEIMGLGSYFSGRYSSIQPDSQLYREWSQLVAMFKKNEDPFFFSDLQADPQQNAAEAWYTAEKRCRLFNSNFQRNRLEPIFWKVKHEIWKLLGDSPGDSWLDLCYVSSGAAIGVASVDAHLVSRFTQNKPWSVTPAALTHALRALRRTRLVREGLSSSELDAPPLARIALNVVRGNKLAYVPKTVETLRPIAVEPLLNGFCQSGVDQLLRSLLRARWGIDLRSQYQNQEMARIGSIDGSFATVDLSSASDTISRSLVQFLLPYDWFVLLDELRSHETQLPDGSLKRLEKFVSMGNNFCFPLQTIIFAGICRALGLTASPGEYRVYGDDIIVSGSARENIVEVLAMFGFVANPRKTFLSGPFRESCGADWLNGVPVRPAYVRGPWDDVRNIHAFLNTLRSRGWEITQYAQLVRGVLGSKLLLRPLEISARLDTCAVSVPLDMCMSSRTVSFDRQLFCWRWKELRDSPQRDYRSQRNVDYERLWCLMGLRSIDGESSRFEGALAPPVRRKTRTKLRSVVA